MSCRHSPSPVYAVIIIIIDHDWLVPTCSLRTHCGKDWQIFMPSFPWEWQLRIWLKNTASHGNNVMSFLYCLSRDGEKVIRCIPNSRISFFLFYFLFYLFIKIYYVLKFNYYYYYYYYYCLFMTYVKLCKLMYIKFIQIAKCYLTQVTINWNDSFGQ